MEGTETLCPHATILNHRWVSGTRSWLLSVKPDQWMHLSPIYTRVHGEWLRYANSTSQFHWRFLLVRDDWGFQVNPLCRHDITSPFPPSGNEGYVRNRDVYMYVRVFIGVSACSEFICMCVCCCRCICMDRVYMYKRVFIGVCMRQVYMYMQVIHKCICIHY